MWNSGNAAARAGLAQLTARGARPPASALPTAGRGQRPVSLKQARAASLSSKSSARKASARQSPQSASAAAPARP